jgi:glucose-6-phosphate 1-dehydrogenase
MEKDITNKGSNVEICEPPVHDLKTEPFTIVIFGGAGDYTRRMLIPSLYHLFHDEALSDDFSIIGFGLPEMSDEQYRSFVFESLEEFSNAPVIKDRWKNAYK